MTLWQLLRFVHRFASRDLVSGGAWRPTLVNIGSTALVTAVTLTAVGLALGSAERKRLEMQERGLPPLYCGNPNLKGELTPDLCARLDQALTTQLGAGAAWSYPFYSIPLWKWGVARKVEGADLLLLPSVNDVSEIPTAGKKNLIVVADVRNVLHVRVFDVAGKRIVDTDANRLTEQARLVENLEKQLKSLGNPHDLTTKEKARIIAAVTPIFDHPYLDSMSGRTLVAADPIQKRVKLLRGAWPARDSDPGFVVTEQFLKQVGRPGAEPPLELDLELKSGNKTVTVIGVVDHLPLSQDFILTDKYYKKLLKWDWEGFSPWADSGPVGRDWPDPAQLSGDLPYLKALDDDGFSRPERKPDDADKSKTVWNLSTLDGTEQPRRTWVDHFKMLRDGLNRENDGNFADIDQIRLKPREGSDTQVEDWNQIGIYADSLAHLEAAKAVVSSTPFLLLVQKDKVYDLENFDQVSNKALWGSVIAGLVLLMNSCANLMVIQQLRAALKVAEIGMLKAMGMGAGLLQSVFLYEGLLIWAAGTLVGIPVGYGLGVIVSTVLIAEPGHVFEAFYCPWYLWLIPLPMAPFFLFSTWFGTRRWRRLPPIRTLRSS
jgi:FtsX-like permease family